MGKIMAVKTALESIHEVKFEVDSRYTVLETIGNGAYGVVCSAYDNKAKTKVAIKKISRIFDIPTIAKRTLRELKILKYLNHHNIISIKDILRPPEDLSKFQDVYVVLDLMESDLHHIIYSKQVLSEDHVRYFLYQMLCGLKYIHSANFLHRDLKPSNLLVNGNCELKIGDFGMARSLDSSPMEQKRVMTEYVQTRWYRAPELMLSVHQFNTGIDMWSVGCIFAEMLARRPLFPGSNYLNQLQLILSVVGLPSEEFISNATSERVKTYISKLPHKDPVPLKTLFPSASNKALNLLQSFLKLDPSERSSAEEALASPFLNMYHNLDDEPTCTPLKFDFDAVPLEKNALRASILNEILHVNASNKGVKLTPVASKLITHVANGSCANQNVAASSSQSSPSIISAQPVSNSESDKDALRKRKHSKLKKDTKCKKPKDQTKENPKAGKDLSDQDRQMLERWTKMQETTKPFVHPIRKHMNELMQLKAQSVTLPDGTQSKDMQGVSGIDSVAGKPKVQFQFTNLVPMQKGGGVTLVKDTAKTEVQAKGKVTASLASGQKAVLVPVGSIPCYRIEGPFNQQGPLVIIQPALAKTQLAHQQVPKSDAGVVSLPDKKEVTKGVPIAAVAPLASDKATKVIATSKPQVTISKDTSTVTTVSKVSITPSVPSLKLVPIVTKAAVQPTVHSTGNPNVLAKGERTDRLKITTNPVHSTQKSDIRNTKDLLGVKSNITVDSSEKRTLITHYQTKSDLPSNSCQKLAKGVSVMTQSLDKDKAIPTTQPVVLGGDIITPSTVIIKNSSKSISNKPEVSISINKQLVTENVTKCTDTCHTRTTSNSEETVEQEKEVDDQDKSEQEKTILPPICAPPIQFTPREKAILQLLEQFQSPKSGDSQCSLVPVSQYSHVDEGIGNELGTKDKSISTTDLQLQVDIRTNTVTNVQEPDIRTDTTDIPEVDIGTDTMPTLTVGSTDEEKMDPNLEKSVNDILMTTLMTPRTPKSGACGYGLGFDLEELLSQTASPNFWNSTSRALDSQTTNTDEAMLPALSASLLNDWLDVRNMEPSDMEELQRELESTSSLLLFDS